MLSDGNIISIGMTTSFGAGSDDMLFSKIDLNGNVIWTKTFGGAGIDRAEDAIENQNGEIIFTGYSNSFGGNFDFVLGALDLNGNLLWSNTYGGASSDEVERWGKPMDIASDNGIVMVGGTQSFGANGEDIYIVKSNECGSSFCNDQTVGLIANSPSIVGINSSLTKTIGGNLVSISTTSTSISFTDNYLCVDTNVSSPFCLNIKSAQKISDTQGNFLAPFNSNDRFESVCNLGDFNGDGINDILAGAKWDDDGGTDKGAVYILYMNANSTVNSYSKISDTQGNFGGLSSIEVFGTSVDTIGDLNNDGVMDIVVGASEYGGGVGAVHVLFLNSNGTVQSSVRIANGLGGFPTGVISGNAEFGFTVSCLNDLNGDGNNEVLIGSFNLTDGGVGRGAVFIAFLNSNGTVQSYQKISSTSGGFTGVIDNGDGFGMVEDLGDYNNDGVRDIAVGAIRDDDGGVDFGAVWILSINSLGNVISHTKISELQGNFSGVLTANDEFGWSVSSLGDIDGDGIGDILVGAVEDDDGGLNKGAAYILMLNGNGTVKQHFKISDLTTGFTGNLDNTDWFGLKTSSVGDFDGNGVVDLAVSAGLDDDGGFNNGAFYVILLEDSCALVNPFSCDLTSNFSFIDLCFGDSVRFTDSSIDGNANIINWQWYFGDGDSIVGVNNPSHYYTSSGVYDVTLVVSNDSNCIDSITIPITINSIFNINQTISICQGDSIVLGGSFQNSSGIYTDSLQTSFGCDSLIITTLTVNPTYSSSQSQSICQGDSLLFGGLYYNSTGIYWDSLQTVVGCDSLFVLNLTVNSTFEENLTETICEGDSILLGGSFQNTPGTYLDSLQTLLGCDSILLTQLSIINASNDTVLASICEGESYFAGNDFQTMAGLFVDTLQANSNGCDSVVYTNLIVNEIPNVIISNDTSILSCSTTELFASGADTYFWSPSVDLSCDNCSTPLFTAGSTTFFTVVGNSNGCIVERNVLIEVEGEADLIIPNVFTPNRDGLNDGFNIEGGCVLSADKKIFNRWGELLFNSNQVNEFWYGRTTAGEEVPEGTYFYLFDLEIIVDGESTPKIFKGTVSLLR